MTDSSPAKTVDDGRDPASAVSQPGDAERKVPLEALAKERAEKRAARDESDSLRKELEQARASIDPKLLEQLAKAMANEAKAIVAAEVAPYKEKAAKLEMATQMRLNGAQVEKVWEVRAKHPTLDPMEALELAKTRNPDVFPAESKQPSGAWPIGALPVTGASPTAGQSLAVDHIALMKEAESKRDFATAHNHAMEAFLKTARNTLLSSKGLPLIE